MRAYTRGTPSRFTERVRTTIDKPPICDDPVRIRSVDKRGRTIDIYLTEDEARAVSAVVNGSTTVFPSEDGKRVDIDTRTQNAWRAGAVKDIDAGRFNRTALYATQPAAYNATMLESGHPADAQNIVAVRPPEAKALIEATLREHGLIPPLEPVTVDPFAGDRDQLDKLQAVIDRTQRQHAELTADLERRVQGLEAATNPEWS